MGNRLCVPRNLSRSSAAPVTGGPWYGLYQAPTAVPPMGLQSLPSATTGRGGQQDLILLRVQSTHFGKRGRHFRGTSALSSPTLRLIYSACQASPDVWSWFQQHPSDPNDGDSPLLAPSPADADVTLPSVDAFLEAVRAKLEQAQAAGGDLWLLCSSSRTFCIPGVRGHACTVGLCDALSSSLSPAQLDNWLTKHLPFAEGEPCPLKIVALASVESGVANELEAARLLEAGGYDARAPYTLDFVLPTQEDCSPSESFSLLLQALSCRYGGWPTPGEAELLPLPRPLSVVIRHSQKKIMNFIQAVCGTHLAYLKRAATFVPQQPNETFSVVSLSPVALLDLMTTVIDASMKQTTCGSSQSAKPKTVTILQSILFAVPYDEDPTTSSEESKNTTTSTLTLLGRSRSPTDTSKC